MALQPTVYAHVPSDSGGHTVYCIVTAAPDGRRVAVRRRFSAFAQLHAECWQHLGLTTVFPVAKTMLNGGGVRQRRVVELNVYLQGVAAAAGVAPPAALRKFLNIGEAPARPLEPRELFKGEGEPAAGKGGAERASPPPPRATDGFELARDVYATAFVLASNATEDMYNMRPWANRQIWPLWCYLAFISVSQAFVLLSLVLIFPVVVDTHSVLVDCARPSEAAAAALEAAAAAAAEAAAEAGPSPAGKFTRFGAATLGIFPALE